MVEEKHVGGGSGIPPGKIGLTGRTFSSVTLKTLTFKFVLHFTHLLISLAVKLISILYQTSLTSCVKYKISSSSVPKRLMTAN